MQSVLYINKGVKGPNLRLTLDCLLKPEIEFILNITEQRIFEWRGQ